MTTLSASALGIMFGASRLGAQDLPLIPGVAFFGLSLLCGLYGMNSSIVGWWAPRGERWVADDAMVLAWTLSYILFLLGLVFVVILPVLT